MTGILDQVQKIKDGILNPTDLVHDSLKKINESQDYNAYLSTLEVSALDKAKAVEEKRSKGEKLGLLAGIPIAVKDNMMYRFGKTTCASKILKELHSPYNATVLERIEEQDGIIIGKTNLDEFAMGSSTENSHFGSAKNPLNPEHIAGGSSGGSAAAVASGTVGLALGSDTGGSVRQPAACCGVVGLKPTYGRVSRYGLVAFASSLDQIGPLANNVEDAAALLSVISGEDKRDQTSSNAPVDDFLSSLKESIKGKKIGLPKEYFTDGLDENIKAALITCIRNLEKQGATLVDVNLPHMEYGVAAYYILATAEASSNLSRYDGIRYSQRDSSAENLEELYSKSRSQGFGWEVKKRIMLGTYVLSAGFYDAYYAQAQKVRRKIKDDFSTAFEKCDVIITPTMPELPPKLGNFQQNPMAAYLGDIYTVCLNLAGLPGVSVPAAHVGGFPVSLQVIAPPFQERGMLQMAAAIENIRGF